MRNFNTRSIVVYNKVLFDPNTAILKISPLHDMQPAWISFLQVKDTEWVVGNRPTQNSDDGRREPASTQLGRWTGTRRPHSRSETGLARGRFAFWTKIASMQIPLTESVMESSGACYKKKVSSLPNRSDPERNNRLQMGFGQFHGVTSR